jgi:hypothetical protein
MAGACCGRGGVVEVRRTQARRGDLRKPLSVGLTHRRDAGLTTSLPEAEHLVGNS